MSAGGSVKPASVSLNRRLVLEAGQAVDDGAGGFVTNWVALGTLWGRVLPRSGRLSSGEAGAVSETGFDVFVRAAPVGQSDRPVPGQRFRMGARLFRIEAVTEEEPRAIYLRCDCIEEVSA